MEGGLCATPASAALGDRRRLSALGAACETGCSPLRTLRPSRPLALAAAGTRPQAGSLAAHADRPRGPPLPTAAAVVLQHCDHCSLNRPRRPSARTPNLRSPELPNRCRLLPAPLPVPPPCVSVRSAVAARLGGEQVPTERSGCVRQGCAVWPIQERPNSRNPAVALNTGHNIVHSPPLPPPASPSRSSSSSSSLPLFSPATALLLRPVLSFSRPSVAPACRCALLLQPGPCHKSSVRPGKLPSLAAAPQTTPPTIHRGGQRVSVCHLPTAQSLRERCLDLPSASGDALPDAICLALFSSAAPPARRCWDGRKQKNKIPLDLFFCANSSTHGNANRQRNSCRLTPYRS